MPIRVKELLNEWVAENVASDPHDFIAVATVGGVGLVSVDIPKSFLVF